MKITCDLVGVTESADYKLVGGELVKVSNSLLVKLLVPGVTEPLSIPMDAGNFTELMAGVGTSNIRSSADTSVKLPDVAASMPMNEVMESPAPAKAVCVGKDEYGFPIMRNPDGSKFDMDENVTNNHDADEDGIGQI
jgi:hypothetical protein